MAKAGRPPKNDPTDVKAIQVYKNPNPYTCDSYSTEKELEDDICKNIKGFCVNILGDEYISHVRQLPLNGRHGGVKRTAKGVLIIDIFIRCKNSNYIIEAKNPCGYSDNRAAIGQVLNYGRYFPDCKLVICTTKVDADTAGIIDYYNLPIIYVFLDNGRYAIHQRVIG